MRAITSRMKRCLALLLAVVLMVPAMSIPAFAAEECTDESHGDCQMKTLAELIVENYGTLITNPDKPLTAAAKAVLTSGALTNDVEYHVDSVLGTENVSLDGTAKTVTAKVKPDGEYTWVPVSAGVYVNDVKVENITLTEDGGVYTGTYKYTGNVFYVQVEYELQTEVDPAAVAELLNVAYVLKGDLDILDSLVTKAGVYNENGKDVEYGVELLGVQHTVLSVLNLLTDENVGSAMGLGEFGTIVGLIYDLTLSEEDGGKLNRTINLPFEFNNSTEYVLDLTMNREDANIAAAEMYAQQNGDTNDGMLDLVKFFDDHSSLGNLEILANHSDDLDVAVASLYEEAIAEIQYEPKSGILKNAGLPSSVGKLQAHINEIRGEKDEDGNIDETDSLVEAAKNWVNNKVLPELTVAGVTGLPASINKLSDLEAVITNLQAERLSVINMVNKQLTALAAAGIPVETVSTGDNAVAEMTARQTQLQAYAPAAAAVSALGNAITVVETIDKFVDGLTTLMGIESEIAKLEKLHTVLDGLVTLYQSLYGQLGSIYDYYGSWQVGSYFVDGTTSDDYSSINSALYAVSLNDLEAYEDSEITDSTVVLATATDKADMNMSDLTIVVRLNTLDGANDVVTSTLKKVVTLPSETSYADVKAEVNAFVAEALASWQTSSLYVDGKYQSEPVTGMPDSEGVLGEDDRTVEIIYNPVDFTVTYVYGEAEDVPYGTTVTLPKHDNATKAWDYMVGGKHYVQGQSFKVTEDVTVTREEGEAYNEIKVFPIAKDRFDVYLEDDALALERITNIINSGALGVEDTIVYVRNPKDCVHIDQAEGDTTGYLFDVTAEPYVAVYQSATALWMPVSVTVYVVGGESFEVKDPVLNGDKYLFAVDTQGEELDHVQVNYELDLDAAGLLSKDSVIGTMNDVLQVYNDVVDQLDDLQTLANGLDDLKMLDKTTLQVALNPEKNSPILYCTVCDAVVDEYTEVCPHCQAVDSVLNTEMALNQIINNNLAANEKLILVSYMENYLGATGGLGYYYTEGVYEAMDHEVQSLKAPMKVLGKDENLLEQLEGYKTGAAEKVQGVINLILAMDLTGPDENLNNVGLNHLLSSLTPNFGATNSDATFEEVPEVTALPGGELVLTHSLPLSALNKVQVTVQITVEDKSGNRVVNVTTPVTVTKDGETATMDANQIEAVVSAVKALIPPKYTHYYLDDPKTQAVEAAYTADGLRSELSKSLTGDLLISYYFKEMHVCTGTIATCTEPSYCIYCKAVLGPVDTSDSAHSWDEGVQTKDPDCVNTGLITYTCSACGGTKTKTVAALGHVMSDFESDNNVTCYSYGTKTAHCVREDVDCEYFVTEPDLDTALLDHTMGAWQKVNDATHTRGCQNVGCTHTETEVHSWGEGSTLYAATCISLGKMVYTCSDGCGATKNEDIPMLNHEYTGALVGDENGHRHLCVNGCGLPGGAYEDHSFETGKSCDEKLPCLDNCGYIKAAGVHAWSGWTEVEIEGESKHQSSCSKCEDVKTEDHTYEGVVTKEPTCAEKGVMTYTCTVCGGGVYTEEIDNSTVAHKYSVAVTAPTCTDKGYTTYTCSVCDDSYDADYVEALGHNYASVVTAPTCTAEGYTTYTCSRCGDSYVGDKTEKVPHVYDDWYVYRKAVCGVDGERRRECINCDGYETEVITAPTHIWDEGVVTKEPTCKAEGVMTYTCSLCGGTKKEAIAVIGCDWDDGVILEGDEPTCTEKGTKTFTCSMCGDTYTEEVPATDHDWDDGVVTKYPTCTEKGVRTYTCQNDSAHTYTEDIAATDHDYDSVVTDPTCTEKGYTTHTCTNVDLNTGDSCTHSYVDTYVNALGHDWGEWGYENDSKKPTCTVPGEERRDCEREGCDHYETRTVAKTAHPDLDENYECDDCGATVCPSHEYGAVVTAPACTERGYTTYTCPVCHDSYVDDYVEELGHDYVSVKTEPTCTEMGYTTHTCARAECGDSYVDSYENSTGHNYDAVVTPPTCTEQGYTTHTCTNVDLNTGVACNHSYEDTFVNATGHAWDEGVVLPGDEATCTKEGTRTYTCQNNDEHTYTEPIEMLDHNYQVVVGSGDEEGHTIKCSCDDSKKVDHVWVADPDDERNVAATENSEGLQVYNCACGAEEERVVPKLKPELPAEDHDYNVDWDQNSGSATMELPDNGGYSNYQMSYTIVLPAYTSQENGFSVEALKITVVVGNEVGETQTVNLREEVMKLPQYSSLLTGDQWTEYFYEAVYSDGEPSDEIQINPGLINLGENQLAVFVNSLNGENDALEFSLVETSEDKYTVIANVADANSVQGAIMDVAMALVTGSYSDIGLKSHAAVNANGYEYLKTDGKISIQALINGILYEDGFGTGTIIDVFTETGAINPNEIATFEDGKFLVGSASDVGAKLQIAYMALGNGGEIAYEVDFLLTISQGSGQLVTVRNALEKADPVVSAETKGGKMQLTLKEKIYEIYQAEMMLTGVADKDDPAIATNEAACKYLHDYLTVLMGNKVNVSTYENTLDKVGKPYDLSAYESILNLIIDEFGKAELSKDCLSVTLSRSGKNTIDKLMNNFGVAVDSDLLGAIKEYGDPSLDLSVGMTAAFEPEKVQFEAAIITPLAGSMLDKAGFATIGTTVSRINNLSGATAVMLLADITGDLTFNHTTVLDLNGKTINGNIVANDKLFIVDSSMDSAVCGMVDGSVATGANGTIYITGGKYRDTLSESYLKNGYVQDSNNVVINELYTIAEDAEGEYTITLHSEFSTKPTQDMGLALGIDLLTDMMLNGFDSAAMTITGDEAYEVYNITLNDLIALFAGADRADQAISAVMEDVDFENIRLFINDLLASVLDFETIAATYEDADSGNDGVIAEYSVTTNNWDIIPEHVVAEDYIEFHLEANTAVSEPATLTFVVDGEMAEALFPELGEVAKATATVDTLEVVYGDKVFDIDSTGNTDVILTLTDSEEKHDTYVAVIAVVLAKAGNTDLLDVLNANGDRNAQWDAFNGVSVKDVVSALKAIDANTDFADLAAEVGLTAYDSTEMDTLNTAYQTLGYTAGALLTRLNITGSSTQKMGALDPDGDGSYVFDDYATTAYTNSLTRSVYGFTAEVDGAMTAKLTLKLFDDPDTYTITWLNDDGSVLRTDTDVAYKAATPAAPTATKDATAQYTYVFAGWFVDADNDSVLDSGEVLYTSADDFPAVTGDVTYTAAYTETVNKYTVTYQYNGTVPAGAAAVPEAKEYAFGATVTVAAEPADVTGYTFSGWKIDGADAGTSFVMPEKAVTIIGIWTEIGGNSWTTEPQNTTKSYDGEPVSINAVALHGEVKVVYNGTANDGDVLINSAGAPYKAGNYTATFTVEGTSEYKGLSKTVTITINKAKYDVQLTDTAFVYDGEEKVVDVMSELLGGISYTTSNDSVFRATNVDTYTVKVSVVDDSGNYVTEYTLYWSITSVTTEAQKDVTVAYVENLEEMKTAIREDVEEAIAEAVVEQIRNDFNGATVGVTDVSIITITHTRREEQVETISAWSLRRSTDPFASITAINPGDVLTYTGAAVVDSNNITDRTVPVTGTITVDELMPEYVVPTVSDLTYTGAAQKLITAGSVTEGGTMMYSPDGVTYSPDIPEGTEAGSYTVYVKIVGAEYYKDVVWQQPLTVNITKASLVAPTPAANLKYTGEPQDLVSAVSTIGTTYFSWNGTDGWTTEIPTGTEVNSYTFYYKVESDNDNYEGISSTVMTVSIGEADAPDVYTVTFVAGNDGDNVSFPGFPGRPFWTIDVPAGMSVQEVQEATGEYVLDPIRTGYTYGGWYTARDYNTTFNFHAPVTEDTYVFAKWTPVEYTITFDVAGGSAVDPITQDYGTDVTVPADPTKTGYTFAGWDKEIPDTMPAENMTITAQWTINTYTVTFVDEDGTTVLQSGLVAYGETPAYTGATPTKEATAQYTYTFAGWDQEVVAVTGDATYTATYSNSTQTYTVTWKNADGTVLETDADVPYDATPTYTGATPIKEADDQYTYGFNGWYPAVTKVSGNATYTATYKAIPIEPGEELTGRVIHHWEVKRDPETGEILYDSVTGEPIREAVYKYKVYAAADSGSLKINGSAVGEEVWLFEGETVKLVAQLSVGEEVKSWSALKHTDSARVDVAVEDETTATFTMPADAVAVTAVTEPTKHTVTLTGTGNGGYRFYTESGEYATENVFRDVSYDTQFKFTVVAVGSNYGGMVITVDGVTYPAPAGGWKQNVEYTIPVTGNVVIRVMTTPVYIPSTPDEEPVDNCCGNPDCKEDKCHALDYTDLSAILEADPDIWWHADGHCYLDYVICNGLMIGISETEFAPDMLMTRAMIVTALYRQEGEPEVTGNATDYYTDVEDGEWYSDAVVWATQNEITYGYGNKLFGTNDSLTREQLATLFYRYTAHKGKDVEASTNVTESYSDGDQISEWAADGMEWACSNGLLIGTGNNMLAPKGDLRRCEFAALLCRWIWGKYDA